MGHKIHARFLGHEQQGVLPHEQKRSDRLIEEEKWKRKLVGDC
jgi:hypothetical protein